MQPTIGIGGLNTAHDEYVSTGFDCFSPPEVESGIDKARSVTVTARPIASITNSGPYNFHFEADPEKSTNAESLRFRGKMRIKKTDGTNLPAQENVSTVKTLTQGMGSCTKSVLEPALVFGLFLLDAHMPAKGKVLLDSDSF